MAVKLFAHCETVTVLVDGSCLLDLGPDHSPSPYGLLHLLKGTRIRQLTVELLNPVRWGSVSWSVTVNHLRWLCM